MGQAFQRHRRVLGGIGTVLISLSLIGWVIDRPGTRTQQDQLHSETIPLPTISGGLKPANGQGTDTTLVAELIPADPWTTVTVRPGQTLAQIFAKQGLGPRDVHQVVHLDESTAKLTKIYPGDELAFRFTADGKLRQLEFQLDEATRLRVERNDQGYHSQKIAEQLVAQVRNASGLIDDSLFLAGRRAGMTDSLIMELAGLFGWDIDFVLDIRSGDGFHVLFEEIYRNGEFLRTGDILAATFINQGRTYQAVRFETENGYEYFAPDGRNMKKAFLRAPLNFSYISSSFNPKRYHPILKRVKAHNGIDYKAPSGTPVYAAGNGRVIEAGYGRYNGNYVFIQHGNNIVTRYLHFSKKSVKKGNKVQQGQVIGYVGATGLAQAPHLHYEFLLNGVHRNPRTVDLPKADPLPPKQMVSFNRIAQPLLAQLERMAQTSSLVAMAK
jgi:murein DD-endopeptidase MepM/ murein hydrolase activator NlpD